MKEYLSKEQIIEILNSKESAEILNHSTFTAIKLISLVKEAPSTDVEEVRHGYWEEWWDDNYLSYCHKCSECGSYPLTKEETTHDEVLSNFCHNCGAKMDGTSKERGGEK